MEDRSPSWQVAHLMNYYSGEASPKKNKKTRWENFFFILKGGTYRVIRLRAEDRPEDAIPALLCFTRSIEQQNIQPQPKAKEYYRNAIDLMMKN
jgi:hypothetical protein